MSDNTDLIRKLWDALEAAQHLDDFQQSRIDTLVDRAEAAEKAAAGLFDAIAHGDDTHREWLKEAISNWFSGLPVPPPRDAKKDLGRVEKERDELRAALRSIEFTYRDSDELAHYYASRALAVVYEPAPTEGEPA